MMHASQTPKIRPLSTDMAAGRRRLLRLALGAGGAALLAGCGFQLRGTATLPFSSLYIGISDTTELGAKMRRYVRATTTTKVVEDPMQAEARLVVLRESRERSILSLDASGRVREFELRYIFVYRVLDSKGNDLVPPTTVALKRDMTFNDTETLAKDAESDLLYRDMQADVIQQVLRRMSVRG